MDFKTLGLTENIIKGLEKENITEPTTAQEKAIPTILEGKNLIMQSETGSGKTLAYLLPLYAKQVEPIQKGLQAIILVPTHELAMQVHHQVQSLSKDSGVLLKSAVIIGKVNIKTQIEKLKQKPHIVIGTCDRILELIKKKKITAHTVKTFVVDEADKMLDKHSLKGVQAVRKTLMRDTQTVLVSATIPDKVLGPAQSLATSAELIKTAETYHIPENIRHMYVVCEKRDKLETLRKLLSTIKPSQSIIFINGTEEIELACEKLKYHKLDCGCIHGKSTKQQRQKSLTQFANGDLKYLVATDIASRGLHIENINTVFSVNISDNPMDYLHRAGRVGRNGKTGTSICIATKNELQFLKKYQNKFGIEMMQIKMQNGEIVPIIGGKAGLPLRDL